ncbi:hypothetical protein BC826DRAFT_971018 [Russula brevipes]|nr:hypothetical protein BC826DRAFT_971018 [Russula brevipes]
MIEELKGIEHGPLMHSAGHCKQEACDVMMGLTASPATNDTEKCPMDSQRGRGFDQLVDSRTALTACIKGGAVIFRHCNDMTVMMHGRALNEAQSDDEPAVLAKVGSGAFRHTIPSFSFSSENRLVDGGASQAGNIGNTCHPVTHIAQFRDLTDLTGLTARRPLPRLIVSAAVQPDRLRAHARTPAQHLCLLIEADGVHDVCGRTRVNVALEASPPPSKQAGPGSGMGPPSDSVRSRPLQTSIREACRDQTVVQSSWQTPGGPIAPSPSPLHSIYDLWCTCVLDVEDSSIALSLSPCFDGDIFGVGKRPVQREIEMDGCVRLVFVEE